MASPAQIAANRRNALKSTGPKDTSLTRYNGLTHGLTAKHGILPGESHEEYDAERSSWFDFLAPANPIAAALADRAFVSFWKLTRATRMERAWTYEKAAEIGRGVDDHARGLIDGGMNLLARHPDQALYSFRMLAPGLDHLIGLWEALAQAVESGWTSKEEHHDRLLNLLGHVSGQEPLDMAVSRASSLLLRSGERGVKAPDPAALQAARITVRRVCGEKLEEYRAERARAWHYPDYRQQLIDRAIAPISKEALLMHRYERNHEKSFFQALRCLGALEKSEIRRPEADPEPESVPEPAPEPVPAAPAVAGEPEKPSASHYITESSDELASVRQSTPPEARPEAPTGSPGRPGGPDGADRGPKRPPKRS